MTLGGRAAEEIVFSEITTGAANDLEKVTATAKQMVMRFGMSEKLGPRAFGHDQSQPFLGPRVQRPSPTTPTRSRARSTTRSAGSSRRRTRPRAQRPDSTARTSTRSRRSCSSARRSSASEFEALLAGKSGERGLRRRRARAERRRRRPSREREPPAAARAPSAAAAAARACGRDARRQRAEALAISSRGHGTRHDCASVSPLAPAVMGDRQRDARLVLRRRACSSSADAAVAHGGAAGRRGGGDLSTSAGSRRGPGAEPVAER